jgi:outer membrane murein-binding lipoprotein Lpp
MNSDEKIIKMLEDLRAGQEQQGKDIASLKTGQEQQGKQLEQQGKLLTGVAASVGTVLEEQQAQRMDIRSLHTDMGALHTEVHAAKDELKAEIISARAEAKADNMDLKATVTRQLKDYGKRIDALEEEAGIPNPDKN